MNSDSSAAFEGSMRLGRFLVFACLFACGKAPAADWFVATNGSDASSGSSLAAPFQTLQRAAGAVQPGDTCWIRGGTYRETLAPAVSGTPAAPITFAAWSNEPVTLSACDPVAGWTASSNSMFQAAVSWTLGDGYDQLFVDSALVHQAIFPNWGVGGLFGPGGVAGVTIDPTNPAVLYSAAWSGKPDNYWADSWFFGSVGYDWSCQCARVVSSTGNRVTVDPATQSNPWFTGSGTGYLRGKIAFLDSPNEWHLQAGTTNTLFLRLGAGIDPSTRLVEFKRRPWCIDVSGHDIVIRGVSWTGGAARLRGGRCTLQDCTGRFLSHFQVFNSGYSDTGNQPQGGGVCLNSDQNIVRGCIVSDTAGCGIWSTGNSNVITRNRISNTDYAGTYSAGITLYGTGDTVTFNTVHTSGRDILRPTGKSSVIRFNDLSDPGQLCKDVGVIYAWGVRANGTRFANNWIHDNPHPLPSPLVYLDNYDAGFVVDHNVCWNSGGDSGIRVNGPALGHVIVNNTLFNCADVGTNPYQQFPDYNPDPAFWTNAVYSFTATNNLFLGTAPQSQLVNWAANDFALLPGAAAVDSGVVLPGMTDGFLDSAPDLGACENGWPAWNAGADARPTLALAATPGVAVRLIASAEAGEFQLVSCSSLTGSWTAVTNAPLTSASGWSVTLPAPESTARYYRLQQN
ncbi:MAG: right-handed parallel beta-helix repeat-containing protein [Verrucomicrobiota bacterium]